MHSVLPPSRREGTRTSPCKQPSSVTLLTVCSRLGSRVTGLRERPQSPSSVEGTPTISVQNHPQHTSGGLAGHPPPSLEPSRDSWCSALRSQPLSMAAARPRACCLPQRQFWLDAPRRAVVRGSVPPSLGTGGSLCWAHSSRTPLLTHPHSSCRAMLWRSASLPCLLPPRPRGPTPTATLSCLSVCLPTLLSLARTHRFPEGGRSPRSSILLPDPACVQPFPQAPV